MLKRLAILGFLIPLAAVGVLAGQDAPKGTPEQGIAKPSSGQVGQQQAGTQDHNQNTQNLPTAHIQAPSPVDEAAKEEARQNLKIQRELALFTGLLVFVGLLQVSTTLWQAWLLKQTRGDVHTQAEWMKTQTEHIGRQADMAERQARLISTQAKQMEEQTEILRDSVAAVKESAKAASAQIKMMKEKERARLSVKPPSPLPAFNVRQRSWGFTISLLVKNDGPTQAVNIAGIAAAIASDNSSFPNGDQDFVSLPTAIGGGEGFPLAVPLFHRFIGRVVPEHFYVHVWGSIEYRDIFDEGKIHSAPFGFRCEMKQIRGDGTGIQDGEWWDWGHPNQEKAT